MMLLHLLLHVLIYHLLSAKGGQKDAAKTSGELPLRGPTNIAKIKEKPYLRGPTNTVKMKEIIYPRGPTNTVKIKEKPYSSPSKDTNYVIKQLKDCYNKDVHLVHEHSSNKIEPDECFSCFCQDKDSAVCWKRKNKRCNKDSLVLNGIGNRDTKASKAKSNDTRIRRSPGFTDIFFRDASRDAFNRNTEEKQCKPYESSFSDDCPPADWCIGCTVCDCDANGRWDCHILSFCTDPKKSKSNGRKVVKKKPTTTLPPGAQPRTSITISPLMRRRRNKKNPSPQKTVVKKSITSKPQQKQQKKKSPIRYKRIARKQKSMFKKRNINTHKPVEININKTQVISENEIPVDVAKQIVKKMMSVVKKLVQKEIYNMTKLVQKMQTTTTPFPRKTRTTYKRRIIGGTLPMRYKREINLVSKETSSPLKILQNEYKGALTTKDAKVSTPIVTSSAMVMQEENLFKSSTISPTRADENINSLNVNTEPIIVIPISTTTSSQNDYYKYILATNIIPLKNNQTVDVTNLKTTAGSETNMINTTAKSITIAKTILNKIEKTTEIKNILEDKSNSTSLNHIEAPKISTISENNSMTTDSIKETSRIINNDNVMYNIAELNPTKNDINLNYLPQVKALKEKINKPFSERQKPTEFVHNDTVNKDSKHKVRGKDINRVTFTKKYNLFKILNYNKCPFLNKLVVNTNGTHSSANLPQKNNVIANFLKDYNNTKKLRKRLKKFSFMKYLRQIFNKMFKRKNSSDRFSRYHILETLCENFGPCNINRKDKFIVRSKLADLDNETMTILKTVKIIKGLLTLLDDSDGNNKTSRKQGSLSSDIQKINSILKGQYGKSFKEPLTETKIIQIEYIKKNTQDFVKSVGKFAVLLDQIISIISKQHVKSDHKHLKNYLNRNNPFQSLRDLLVRYNLVQNDFMKKMFQLVNSFENKVYDKPKVSAAQDLNSGILIEDFSRNILTNLRKLKHLAQTLNYNGRNKRETKDDDAMEYLLMIMEYLLKQNHPLDSAPANDGIDLLIEAIKNAPDIKTVRKKVLVNTPTSGSETTMMTISRNILYRSTTETSVNDADSENDTSNEDSEKSKTDTSEDASKTKIEDNKDLFDIIDEEKEDQKIQFDRRAEDLPSDSYSTTKDIFYDDIEKNTVPSYLNAFEPTESPQLIKEEDSINNSSINQGKSNDDVYTDNPGMVNNNNYDNTETANVFSNTVNNNYETNTGYDVNKAEGNNHNANAADSDDYYTKESEKSNNNIKAAYDNTNTATEEIVPEVVLGADGLKGEEDSVKKSETVYTGDIDEEETTPVATSILETEITSTISPDFEYPNQKYKPKEIKTLDSYNNDKIDKKSKLEWIEENFRREYSNYDEDKLKTHEGKRENIKPHTVVNVVPVRTRAPEHHKKRVADVSLISNESFDAHGKKKNKINTEEVMFKKQMDLLNSLDYVTEKGEFDDNESKDGNADERYSETFPSYFV